MANKTSQPVSAVIAKQKPAAKSTDRTVAAPTRAVDSAAYASLNLDNLQLADILTLQRIVGNSATTRLIQTKLTVGPAGDQYEQEADRVAAQVMTMPASTAAQQQSAVQRQAEEEEEIQAKPLAESITPLVQRQAEEEEEIQTKPIIQRAPEEEDELQMKPLGERVQRVEEEEELQAKPGVQRASSGAGFEVSGDFEQQLAASQGSGSPLPVEVRAFMEPRFGADFDGVRLHTGSESAQLNRSVSAQAFTLGQDIYLGEGKTDLESTQGKQLLAHELTHVVQQTGGRLQRHIEGIVQRVDEEVEELVKNARISADRKQHILERHGPESTATGAGKFYGDWDEISSLIWDTLDHGSYVVSNTGLPGWEFEYGFSDLIGININGKQTKWMRVKLSTLGNVITAHPI